MTRGCQNLLAPEPDPIQMAFKPTGITAPTAGATHGYGYGISARELSIAQQRSQNADYQTVILNEPPSAQAGVMTQGHVAVTRPYGSNWALVLRQRTQR